MFFLALQALAIKREEKAGGAVSDGGLAVGILLLLAGVAGLAARFYFGGVEGLTTTEPMALLQAVLLVGSTVIGAVLLAGAGRRKRAAG
ncbi:MAG: hypothetical protein EON57_13200 [Alphaproteobacteria bacterium]|nr:MAG: hypothetical protein EON57_13200 [Alphaproteobacteria bacterium]